MNVFSPVNAGSLDSVFWAAQSQDQSAAAVGGIMKRMIVVALVALMLPGVAWARYVWFLNERGTIAISNEGIVSKGSQLVFFLGIVPPAGHSLGTFSFSTGALMSGSLQAGGTFSSVGSRLVVTGKGDYGEPKGIILDATFIGTIRWTLISKTGEKLVFNIHADVCGQVWNGGMICGAATQTIETTEEQLAHGIAHIVSGRFLVQP